MINICLLGLTMPADKLILFHPWFLTCFGSQTFVTALPSVSCAPGALPLLVCFAPLLYFCASVLIGKSIAKKLMKNILFSPEHVGASFQGGLQLKAPLNCIVWYLTQIQLNETIKSFYFYAGFQVTEIIRNCAEWFYFF